MPAEPFLVVHRSGWKAARSILVALIFLVVCVLIHLAPSSPQAPFFDQLAKFLAGWLGPPVFLTVLVVFIFQFFSKTPVLVIDDVGISTYGREPLMWEEIASVEKFTYRNQPCFGIKVREIDQVVTRMPAAEARSISLNVQMTGFARFVVAASLPMKVDDLFTQIHEYVDAKIAEHVPEADDDVNDDLYDAELQAAMTAVAENDTPENRRDLYRILLKINYIVALAAPSENGEAQMLLTKNREGDTVLPTFTDPGALRRWADAASMLVMTAQKFFELAVERDYVEVHVNPAGPAGGKLTRAEYTALAKAEMPE